MSNARQSPSATHDEAPVHEAAREFIKRYEATADGDTVPVMTVDDQYVIAKAYVSETSANVGGPYGWRKPSSNEPLWEEPVLAYFSSGAMRVCVLTPAGWREADGNDINTPLWWRRLPEAPK